MNRRLPGVALQLGWLARCLGGCVVSRFPHDTMNRRDWLKGSLAVAIGAASLAGLIEPRPYAWSGLVPHQTPEDFAAYLRKEGHSAQVYAGKVFWIEKYRPTTLYWLDNDGKQEWTLGVEAESLLHWYGAS